MLYHTKKPRIFYQFPSHFIFPKGEDTLWNIEGKELQTDLSALEEFKLAPSDTNKVLFKELNLAANQFMNAVKEKTGQKKPDEVAEEVDYLDTDRLKEKFQEGKSFLTDMGSALSSLWNATTTEDEANIQSQKEQLQAIKDKLQAKGIPLNTDMDSLVDRLRKKHRDPKDGSLFKEGAAKLEEELEKLKSDYQAFFKKDET